jgi:hypothetical protein
MYYIQSRTQSHQLSGTRLHYILLNLLILAIKVSGMLWNLRGILYLERWNDSVDLFLKGPFYMSPIHEGLAHRPCRSRLLILLISLLKIVSSPIPGWSRYWQGEISPNIGLEISHINAVGRTAPPSRAEWKSSNRFWTKLFEAFFALNM